jgi:glutathione S-transferase
MKLYFTPGACSLSVHIALHESGLPFEAEKVDLRGKKTADGGDYFAVNPRGAVPALVLDNGQVLTECAVLLQYVADQAPEKNLAPAFGTLERYRTMEALNFVSSELHKGFGPLWNPATPDAYKAVVVENLSKRFADLNAHFEKHAFLANDTFSVADAYLFVVTSWSKYVKLDLSPWPALGAFMGRMADRAGVQAALKAEGLV